MTHDFGTHDWAELTDNQIHAATTANRLMIADFLEGLTVEDWRTDSLCEGWNVHTTAAHFLQPMLVGFGRFFITALRYRGDTPRVVDNVTRKLARRSATEVIALLRSHAADQVSPPRVGPMGPFAETCIHLQDIAIPIRRDIDVPTSHWRVLLSYLVTDGAAKSLVEQDRIDNVRFIATDCDWSYGDGPEVRGIVASLGMVMAGRPAALEGLRGTGVDDLRTRLS
jgi:uncharacterized protein (TIGR03083 family)